MFRFDHLDSVAGWRAIDDRVMGGLSRSHLRFDAAGHAVFEGEVSLAQGGGFASVRSAAAPLGRAGATHCVIEARGDGRTYKLSLFAGDGFDTVSHQAAFRADAPGWQTIRLPIRDFQARFRGRAVPGAPALDPARIRQAGLTIADAQPGAFALGVRSIGLA